MELNDLHAHLDNRLDRIEAKIDDHLERISKAESSIEWLKIHVKITTSAFLAVAGFFAAAFFKLKG